mmetsp:Transcript_28953/g.47478  ORF Transcript_28953/g.47478 Transcript_28953/m.47478 type:complete len:81 (+) Transcript_28953:666-908(+)
MLTEGFTRGDGKITRGMARENGRTARSAVKARSIKWAIEICVRENLRTSNSQPASCGHIHIMQNKYTTWLILATYIVKLS